MPFLILTMQMMHRRVSCMNVAAGIGSGFE